MINMFPMLVILISLIFVTPITVILGGPIIIGLLAAVAAISVAMVGLRTRPGEASFLSTVIRPVSVAAMIPAIWMLFQALPLQSLRLVHPIWQSTAAALGVPVAGSVSIDPGATLISFVQYLSAIAIAFVAAAAAIDRRRAEWIFFALTISTTLIASDVTGRQPRFFRLTEFWDGGSCVAAIECAALGFILAGAAALHTFERSKTRRPDRATLDLADVCVWLSLSRYVCWPRLLARTVDLFRRHLWCRDLVAAVMIVRFGIGPWGIAAIIS